MLGTSHEKTPPISFVLVRMHTKEISSFFFFHAIGTDLIKNRRQIESGFVVETPTLILRKFPRMLSRNILSHLPVFLSVSLFH